MNFLFRLHKHVSRIYPEIVNISELDAADMDQMYEIMKAYYAELCPKRFEYDLRKKNKVILIRNSSEDRIVGFSTLLIFEESLDVLNHSSKTVTGVFSGDTIIEQNYWGGTALQLAFGLYLCWLKLKSPWKPVYWFLISKGYKTYLLMGNNFPTHYPRYEAATPSAHAALMAKVYGKMYKETWDQSSGTIKNNQDYRLKLGVAAPDKRLKELNPRVAYFLGKNPQWHNGHELACIAEMNFSVLTHYIGKKLKSRLKKIQRRLLGQGEFHIGKSH